MGPKKLPKATAEAKPVEGPAAEAQSHDVHKALLGQLNHGSFAACRRDLLAASSGASHSMLLGGVLQSKLPRRVLRKRSGCTRRPQPKEGFWGSV